MIAVIAPETAVLMITKDKIALRELEGMVLYKALGVPVFWVECRCCKKTLFWSNTQVEIEQAMLYEFYEQKHECR